MEAKRKNSAETDPSAIKFTISRLVDRARECPEPFGYVPLSIEALEASLFCGGSIQLPSKPNFTSAQESDDVENSNKLYRLARVEAVSSLLHTQFRTINSALRKQLARTYVNEGDEKFIQRLQAVTPVSEDFVESFVTSLSWTGGVLIGVNKEAVILQPQSNTRYSRYLVPETVHLSQLSCIVPLGMRESNLLRGFKTIGFDPGYESMVY